MTLFPEMFEPMKQSILGRALEKGYISFEAINIRDYAFNKHNKVDDYTYGGGAGMLMQAEPVYLCYEAIKDSIISKRKESLDDEITIDSDEPTVESSPRVIYLTPQGKTFSQEMARDFAKEDDIIFLCGHYEGIDERVLEEIVTDNVSIGDYVLTGGELPAMVLMDAISRFVKGVLNNDISAETESFTDGLLEYPQYSRPEVWHDKHVPEILMSGHHANVEKWRLEQSLIRTKERRPDLYESWVERNPDYFKKKKKK